MTLLPMLKFYSYQNKEINLEEILEMNRIRNEVVHGIRNLDDKQARDITDKIKKITSNIDVKNKANE